MLVSDEEFFAAVDRVMAPMNEAEARALADEIGTVKGWKVYRIADMGNGQFRVVVQCPRDLHVIINRRGWERLRDAHGRCRDCWR